MLYTVIMPIITAIIAALSVLIGACIPHWFLNKEKQIDYENDRTSKIDEIRRKEYYTYLEALQTMINEGTRDSFLPLQASTNRLLLFAGPKLSDLINQFSNEIITRTIQNEPFTLEEHTKYQTDIINAMREELGISSEKLEKVSMVRAGF